MDAWLLNINTVIVIFKQYHMKGSAAAMNKWCREKVFASFVRSVILFNGI